MPEDSIYGIGGAGHFVEKNTECGDDQKRLSDLLRLSYEPMLVDRL
jgi:hypothetical protein